MAGYDSVSESESNRSTTSLPTGEETTDLDRRLLLFLDLADDLAEDLAEDNEERRDLLEDKLRGLKILLLASTCRIGGDLTSDSTDGGVGMRLWYALRKLADIFTFCEFLEFEKRCFVRE